MENQLLQLLQRKDSPSRKEKKSKKIENAQQQREGPHSLGGRMTKSEKIKKRVQHMTAITINHQKTQSRRSTAPAALC